MVARNLNQEPDSSVQDEEFAQQRRRFRLEEGVFIVLLLLSILGISVTRFSPEDGYWYWLMMVGVFGTLAIFISWLKNKKSEFDFSGTAKEQMLHWTCSLLVIGGAFLLQKSERIDENAATLVVLLILSLATMLDGIRIGWQFSLIGFFLGANAIIIAYIEQFMIWSVLLSLAIIGGTIAWEIWTHRRAYR